MHRYIPISAEIGPWNVEGEAIADHGAIEHLRCVFLDDNGREIEFDGDVPPAIKDAPELVQPLLRHLYGWHADDIRATAEDVYPEPGAPIYL